MTAFSQMVPEINIKSISITPNGLAGERFDGTSIINFKTDVLLTIQDISPTNSAALSWYNVKNYSKYFKIYCMQVFTRYGGVQGQRGINGVQEYISSRTQQGSSLDNLLAAAQTNVLLLNHAFAARAAWYRAAYDVEIAGFFPLNFYSAPQRFAEFGAYGADDASYVVQLKELSLEDAINPATKSVPGKDYIFNYAYNFELAVPYSDTLHPGRHALRNLSYFMWIDFDIFQAFEDLQINEIGFAEQVRNPIFTSLASRPKRVNAIRDGQKVGSAEAFFYEDGRPYSGPQPRHILDTDEYWSSVRLANDRFEARRLVKRMVPNARIMFVEPYVLADSNTNPGYGLGLSRPMTAEEEALNELRLFASHVVTRAEEEGEYIEHEVSDFGVYGQGAAPRHRMSRALAQWKAENKRKDQKLLEASCVVNPVYGVPPEPMEYNGVSLQITINLKDLVMNRSNLPHLWGGLRSSIDSDLLLEELLTSAGSSYQIYREQIHLMEPSKKAEENKFRIRRIPGSRKRIDSLQSPIVSVDANYEDTPAGKTFVISIIDQDPEIANHVGCFLYSIEILCFDPIYRKIIEYRRALLESVEAINRFMGIAYVPSYGVSDAINIGFGLGSAFAPFGSVGYAGSIDVGGYFTEDILQSNAAMYLISARDFILTSYINAITLLRGSIDIWDEASREEGSQEYLDYFGDLLHIRPGYRPAHLEMFYKQLKSLLAVYDRILSNNVDPLRLPTSRNDEGNLLAIGPYQGPETRIKLNKDFTSDIIRVDLDRISFYAYGNYDANLSILSHRRRDGSDQPALADVDLDGEGGMGA